MGSMKFFGFLQRRDQNPQREKGVYVSICFYESCCYFKVIKKRGEEKGMMVMRGGGDESIGIYDDVWFW